MTEPEPRRRFANAFARAALALPRGISPGLARRLAPGLGSVLYRLDPARGKVLENLELALGGEMNPSERETLARRFYAHLVLLTCEISWMSRWSAEQITSRYENRGVEHLWNALHAGKGAIMISGHVGNWEAAAAYLAHVKMPITVVVRSQGESPIEDHLTRMRSRHGIECVPDTKAADCIRALRRNRVLILLIDRRHQGPGGICVPFFGQPARSTPGPARLALLTGAPVIACGSWRRPDGGIEGLVEPPLPLIRTGDSERDIWLNTAGHQAAIERLVRHAPEQWIWHRRRWRLRKREPGPLYAELTRPAP